MSDDVIHSELTPDRRDAMRARRADSDRTLSAVHALEAAVGAAGPLREGPWRDAVRNALDILSDAAALEEANAAAPDSLLSDIARNQPRLRPRVHGVRAHYRHVRDSIAHLRPELDRDPAQLDIADLRDRIATVLSALRLQRARESDLIYEAYYDAFKADLIEESETA